jgi:hypothetical protein
MLRKFTYEGPCNTAFTLRLADGASRDVVLHRGREVELPDDNEYVQSLVSLGHLVIDDDPEPDAPPAKPKKGAA